MKKYLKTAVLRGLVVAGFGPLVVGVVYLCIHLSGCELVLTASEVFIAILSSYILAFIAAGASVFNQIEGWSAAKSLLFHFTTYYIIYFVFYLVNRWLPFSWSAVAIFTAIFVVAYFAVWFGVYFSVKAAAKKMNKNLK